VTHSSTEECDVQSRLFMRKFSLVVAVVVLVFSVSFLPRINPCTSHAADACLSCHGDADKLKSMISDDDFNLPAGAEGFG